MQNKVQWKINPSVAERMLSSEWIWGIFTMFSELQGFQLVLEPTIRNIYHYTSARWVVDISCLPGADSIHISWWRHQMENFPRYWPFVRGIHRSPVNSMHRGQCRGALLFTLMSVWINGWVNNGEAGNLRRHHAHFDDIVKCINLNMDDNPFFGETSRCVIGLRTYMLVTCLMRQAMAGLLIGWRRAICSGSCKTSWKADDRNGRFPPSHRNCSLAWQNGKWTFACFNPSTTGTYFLQMGFNWLVLVTINAIFHVKLVWYIYSALWILMAWCF